MIWIVNAYKDGRFIALSVPWAFKSRGAAEWWIANRADRGFTHYAEQWPVYSLEDVQSFTA